MEHKFTVNSDGSISYNGEVFVKGEMKPTIDKEALLKEARERYPIGTKYKDLLEGGIEEVKGEFKFYVYKNVVYITDGYGGEVYKDGVWAETTIPTLEDIYNEVKPEWFVVNVDIVDSEYENYEVDNDQLPTKEDAEHHLAAMQLTVLAKYWNGKFKDEEADCYFFLLNKDSNNIIATSIVSIITYGQPLFTLSAAKTILTHYKDVLNKYFRIKN